MRQSLRRLEREWQTAACRDRLPSRPPPLATACPRPSPTDGDQSTRYQKAVSSNERLSFSLLSPPLPATHTHTHTHTWAHNLAPAARRRRSAARSSRWCGGAGEPGAPRPRAGAAAQHDAAPARPDRGGQGPRLRQHQRQRQPPPPRQRARATPEQRAAAAPKPAAWRARHPRARTAPREAPEQVSGCRSQRRLPPPDTVSLPGRRGRRCLAQAPGARRPRGHAQAPPGGLPGRRGRLPRRSA